MFASSGVASFPVNSSTATSLLTSLIMGCETTCSFFLFGLEPCGMHCMTDSLSIRHLLCWCLHSKQACCSPGGHMQVMLELRHMSHEQPVVSFSGSYSHCQLPPTTPQAQFAHLLFRRACHCIHWRNSSLQPFSALSNEDTKKDSPPIASAPSAELGHLLLHVQFLHCQPCLVLLAHVLSPHFSHGCIRQQLSPHLCVCLTLVCLTLLPGSLSIASFGHQFIVFA